jgi:hypothetical protein
MWIQALEKKAEEMSDVNGQLQVSGDLLVVDVHKSLYSCCFLHLFQNEISFLKHEVAQLKALLLAHRDCPLSISQQKTNPGLFDQLEAGNPLVIDMTGSDQQTTEAAASALTQMAERATMESCNI